MTDFIREVNEELRQDQFRRFLSRYWPVLLAAVVAVLAGVGGWRAYDYATTRKAQDAGGRYLEALNLRRDGKTGEAATAFTAIAKDAPSGYALLARFGLASDTGRADPAAGAKLFDAVAADGAVDPALQNLARLRAALLLVDSTPYAELKARLAPLADANSGLRNSARELLAVAALKANQGQEAGRWLDAIESDPTAPAQLRQRAEAMTGLVRAGSGDAVITAPAATSSAIPGLTLPSPTLALPEATPFDPAPGATGSDASGSEPPPVAATSPALSAVPPPVSAPDASASPGRAPAIPPAQLPAPGGATPPTSETAPGAAPPK